MLSFLFVFLALRDVNFKEVGETLARTNYALALVALCTVITTTMAKAARWRVLFYPKNTHFRYRRLFSIILIGQMVNFVLPARSGELVRAYLLGEMEMESKVRVLGTIAVEKALNLAVLSLSAVVLLPSVALPQWLEYSWLISAVVALFALLTFIMIATKLDKFYMLMNQVVCLLPVRAQGFVSRHIKFALSGLEALRYKTAIWQLCGWSILTWCLAVLTNYVTFLAVGLPASLITAVFLLLVLQLGIAVPSLPGRMPMFYLTMLALSMFAIDRNQAFVYAVVLYALVYLPPLLLGPLLLFWESIDLTKLRTATAGSEAVSGELS